MEEALAGRKRHLALDTDWVTALNVIWGFVACALIGLALTWSTLHGSFKASPPSWSTPLFAALLIYMGIKIKDSGMLFKIGTLVFAIGPISQIVLWLLRASVETYFINALFVRWIYALVCFGCCAYAIYWFKTKIRYV
jgi:hypothetical protein